MGTNEQLMCRLCLNICQNDFGVIEGTTQEILNFIVPNLDLSISKEPVLCDNCMENLKNCFNFKADCLSKKNSTSCFVEDIDIDVNSQKMSLSEDIIVINTCYFCMKLINHKLLISVKNEDMNVVPILEEYFPELVNVQNIPANSKMCTSCYDSLQHHLYFINGCLAVETKIREYCKVEEVTSGQVDLSNVLHFTPKTALQRESVDCTLNTVMAEEEHIKKLKNEDIKVEIKSENVVEIEELGIGIKKENVQMELNDHVQSDDRTLCVQSLVANSEVTKKEVLEIISYKCDMWSYKAKCNGDLQEHKLNHKGVSKLTTYQCEICTFVTRHKPSLQRHMLLHKNGDEVPLYKCQICNYEVKRKDKFRKHMMNHNSTSKETLYECEICAYQTTHKKKLERHALTHKILSEVTMYQCGICGFGTKHKDYLPKHMLSHKKQKAPRKTSSKVKLHKCKLCRYKTKYRAVLKRHMLTHNSTLEIIVHECQMCRYRTENEVHFQGHMQLHKSNDTPVYKCEICDFRTKYTRNLRLHKLTHQGASEVVMYTCGICGMQTKRKNTLRGHIVRHNAQKSKYENK